MVALVRPRSWGRQMPTPAVAAQIDWGHPLAQGLVGAVILRNGSPQELVSGRLLSVSGGMKSTTNGLVGDSATARALLTNLPPALEPTDRVSMVWRGRWLGNMIGTQQNAGVAGTGLDAIGGSAPYVPYAFFRSDDAHLAYGFGGGVGNLDSHNFNVNLFGFYGLTSQFGITGESGAQVGYVNGLVNVTGSDTNSWPLLYSPTSRLTISGDAADTITDRSSNVSTELVYVWNRILSPEEMQRLYLEPYAFIVPPARALSYVMAPAAPAVIISSPACIGLTLADTAALDLELADTALVDLELADTATIGLTVEECGTAIVTPTPPAGFDAADWGTVLGEYDFSDTSKYTQAGGRISAVAPTSGSWGLTLGYSTGGGGDRRPYSGRTFNGHAVLDCKSGDNTGANCSLLQVPLAAPQSQPITLVAVVQSDTAPSIPTGGTGNSQFLGNHDPQPTLYFAPAPPSGHWRMYAGGEVDPPVVSDTNPHVLVGIFNGTSSELWLDGVKITTFASPQSNPLVSIEIGADNSAVSWFDGWIGHAIYYLGVVADPAGLSDALATKWGI